MKCIKAFGLVAAAALAVMAFVGAGSASATTLCQENVNPCPAGQRYAKGTKLEASLKTGTNAVLTTKGGLLNPTVTCKKSTTTDVLTAESGSPLLNEITALTFTECTANLGSGKCTVTSVNLPYKSELAATGSGNGTLTVTSGGKGNPGALVECGELPTCTYGAAKFVLDAIGGAPGEVLAKEEPLSGGAFPCPPESKWTATYVVNNPTKGWLEKEP
jgi:hypothetical protein